MKYISYSISIIGLFSFLSSCGKSNASTPSSGGTKGGTITYVINGNTYSQTDNINALLLDGKFAACTDNNLDAKVGDGEMMATTSGTVKSGCYLSFTANGVYYARGKTKINTITLSSYDGNTVKGTFSGVLYKDGDYKNGETPVSGSFETNDITKL